MRAERRDGQLGRHAGVADGVRAAHPGKAEALRHVGRIADLLKNLDGVAPADDAQLPVVLAQRAAQAVGVLGRDRQDRVRAAPLDCHVGTHPL